MIIASTESFFCVDIPNNTSHFISLSEKYWMLCCTEHHLDSLSTTVLGCIYIHCTFTCRERVIYIPLSVERMVERLVFHRVLLSSHKWLTVLLSVSFACQPVAVSLPVVLHDL